MARLRVVSGPLAGQTFDVENEVVIGREDTDLTIDDVELSRRHAVVRRHASRLQVEDLGSTNGTFVDGTRIEEPTILGGGAEIQIGTTKLVVEGVLPAGREGAEPETPASRASEPTRASIEIPPEMRKQPAAAAAASARRAADRRVTAQAGAAACAVQPAREAQSAARARVAVLGAGRAVVWQRDPDGDRAGSVLRPALGAGLPSLRVRPV